MTSAASSERLGTTDLSPIPATLRMMSPRGAFRSSRASPHRHVPAPRVPDQVRQLFSVDRVNPPHLRVSAGRARLTPTLIWKLQDWRVRRPHHNEAVSQSGTSAGGDRWRSCSTPGRWRPSSGVPARSSTTLLSGESSPRTSSPGAGGSRPERFSAGWRNTATALSRLGAEVPHE